MAALRIVELPSAPSLAALKATDPALFPCLLESTAGGPQGRHDLLFAAPDAGLMLDARGRLSAWGIGVGSGFAETLSAQLRQPWPESSEHADLPCIGGWVVLLGYEYASRIEACLELPVAEDPFPTALALRCPAVVQREVHSGRCRLVAQPGHDDAVERVLQALARAARPSREPGLPAVLLAEAEPQRFLDGVQRIHEYLRAGDVFQVNLSRGWRGRFAEPPTPAALHAALRRANPAPFAAWLDWQGGQVFSSSPERLIQVRERLAQTRPIAGTRPRLPGEDEADRIRELVGHAKERAEHIMLIDLERNDLGRVCVPGSIGVDELMVVESYAHVHHIVSNVRGRLRDGVGPIEVLHALFPGGTITGCPKLRCMQIIAELEGEGRGIYTGSLGYIDPRGRMDFNILIRSLWLHGSEFGFRAGAGIVVDSDPLRELEETRAKARGLLRALGWG